MNSTKVKLDEINNIKVNLMNEANSISNLSSIVLNNINNSKECLNLSGVDTNFFYNKMKLIYMQINARLHNLSYFIESEVENRYGECNRVLRQRFNNQLGDEIASILGLKMRTILSFPISSPEIEVCSTPLKSAKKKEILNK